MTQAATSGGRTAARGASGGGLGAGFGWPMAPRRAAAKAKLCSSPRKDVGTEGGLAPSTGEAGLGGPELRGIGASEGCGASL